MHNAQVCVRCSREIIRFRQRTQSAHTAFGILSAVVVNMRFLHCQGRRAAAARDVSRDGRVVIIMAALKGHRSISQKATSIRIEPMAPHSLDRHTLHAECAQSCKVTDYECMLCARRRIFCRPLRWWSRGRPSSVACAKFARPSPALSLCSPSSHRIAHSHTLLLACPGPAR